MTALRPYLALGLLCLVLYVPGMALVPPLDRDEARYAQASRQMVETGDWGRLYFQDEPRLKKPAGVYWLQAAAVTLLSDAASPKMWPYRLPSLLAALAASLMTFYFGSFLIGREGAFLAAALLGGCLMLVTEAHLAKTDAVLLACVVAAQGALARFYQAARGTTTSPPGWGAALTFWAAQGLGILVKGPIVPFLSALTYITLSLADRDFRWGLRLKPLPGLVFAAAIAAPWFHAISQATKGGFMAQSVGQDLIPKLLGGQESHGGWPGYYLVLALLTFWPASLFLAPALHRAWAERRQAAVRFCLAWIGPLWLVLELTPTKLPHYTLPTYPALALLVGATLTSPEAQGLLKGRIARALCGVWIVLGLALAGGLVWVMGEYGGGVSALGLLAALSAAGVAGLGGWRFFTGQGQSAASVILAGAGLTFVLTFSALMPGLDALWLSRSVQDAVAKAGTSAPVAVAEYHEPSLVFLLGTATKLTDGAGAAAHVLGEPGALAVVGGREDEAFQAAIAQANNRVETLATLEGFNYSRGRATVLRLYRRAKDTP